MNSIITVFGDSLNVHWSGWDTFYLILIFAPIVFAPIVLAVFVIMSKKKTETTKTPTDINNENDENSEAANDDTNERGEGE